MTPCPARIRPFPDSKIMDCGHPAFHTGPHESVLLNYAYGGSSTTLTRLESDRRNFTGEWIECQRPGNGGGFARA